jgi:transaldolase/transaldolase/glucose-6-phosphate isomerase
MTNPLVQLGHLGQSPWFDYITRDLVTSGELQRLIAEDGLKGMTSNPTIFEKAIAGSALYDNDIRRMAEAGLQPKAIFERLAVADVRAACDAFAEVHRASAGLDGLVSLEVDPTLAHDTGGTTAEARRLWAEVNRPNAMIKIPGTVAGLPAIACCLSEGINVNVTLLFSVARYRQVIAAFLDGLEARLASGGSVRGLASVASFFVSRLDGKVDAQLDQSGADRALRGTAAIANACRAYAAFEETTGGERWQQLAQAGALVQRPLWASTSTKDPAYPDVYYVEALIGQHTVNTLPPATFEAYRDHGAPELRIQEGVTRADGQLEALRQAGIDLATITAQLEAEGVSSFAASHTSLLAGIDSKLGALTTR